MIPKNRITEWEGNKYHHYTFFSPPLHFKYQYKGTKNGEQFDKKKSEIIITVF